MKIKTIILTLSLTGLSLINLSAMADGASIASDKCAACHGKDGNSKYNKVPNIAGFSLDALTDMLNEYKSNERIGDKFKPDDADETDMNIITKDMSDADIEALAKYYSSQKYQPHFGKSDAALAQKGAKRHKHKCEKCHSDGATNPEDDASLLAGQSREYLTRAFEKLSNGDQPMPKKMKKKFKKLSDKDKQALIEYYVSGGGASK